MRTVIVVAVVAAVSLAAVHRPASAQRALREVVLDAFVQDRQGKAVDGLTAADFRVRTATGVEIPVRDVRFVSRGRDAAEPETIVAGSLQATNRHASEARLFVVIYEPNPAAYRSARTLLDELARTKAESDAVALFVPGRPELTLPPTADPVALNRAIGRLQNARIAFEPAGLTTFVLEEVPRIYQSFIATRWAQRALLLLTAGYVHPAGLQHYRSWNAWAQRANAPMHGIDPIGAPAMFDPGFAAGDHPLLRLATQETSGLLFLNSSLEGVAGTLLAASGAFYRVTVDVPAGIVADQTSIYMSVRPHPTARVRSRLRARIPMPDPAGAYAPAELGKALDAPLPMDEIPLSLSLGASSGATVATLAFHQDADGAGEVVVLPPTPMTVALAAVTTNGRLHSLGSRQIGPPDLRIEGCCAIVRQDITIPKDAIAVRAAVYQHASGRAGAVFLPVSAVAR